MKVLIWRSIYKGLREKSYICTLEMVVIECILLLFFGGGGGGGFIGDDVKGNWVRKKKIPEVLK